MAKTASKSKDVAKITRREGLRKALFFSSWGVFVVFAGMLGVSIVRFVYPRIVWEPSSLFKIGKPDEYEVGSVTTMGERRVYILRVK